MRPYRVFNWIFALLALPLIVGVGILAACIDRSTGELTRVGGYLEDDYGRNAMQEEFLEPLFVRSRQLSDYDRHYDVVVYGDSFSKNQRCGWQSWLVATTGWRVITVEQDRVALADLLEWPMFHDQPPTLFIYQAVERASVTRLGRLLNQLPEARLGARATPDPLAMNSQESELVSVGRERDGEFQQRIGMAQRYLCYTLSRRVLGHNPSDAVDIPVLRADLFSNARPESTLIFVHDYNKRRVGKNAVGRAGQGIDRLTALVERSGRTRCQVLIFPDKLTVYDRYVAAGDRCSSVIPRLDRNAGTMIRIDLALQSLVEEGVRDVYQPSGTHCSSAGYRRAAEAILRTLVARNLAVDN